ncbi:TPA: hypothetical protein EYP66_19730 [Candidatus Poribacteria bacterium]|nr:hypothetical protein [Candidatus Poribacteria bacterium]
MKSEALTNPHLFLKEYREKLESLSYRKIRHGKLTDNLIIEEKALPCEGGEKPKSYLLKKDGYKLIKSRNPSLLIPYLEWEIFHAYIDEISEDFSVFHAASIVKDGKAILLVGESGKGKTTLTVSLVKRGFRYLSDDLSAIHPVTLKVLPTPKAVHLKGESMEFFPSLSPEFVAVPYPDGFFPGFKKALCCFPTKDILPALDTDFSIHLILFLRRCEAIELQLAPKSQAAAQFFAYSYNRALKDFNTAMQLAQKTPAFFIPVGELSSTCLTIERLFKGEIDV